MDVGNITPHLDKLLSLPAVPTPEYERLDISPGLYQQLQNALPVVSFGGVPCFFGIDLVKDDMLPDNFMVQRNRKGEFVRIIQIVQARSLEQMTLGELLYHALFEDKA